MENKDTNKYKVKVLKTSYERCVPERLDKLKTEYDLIIRSIKMPAKEIDSYGDYANAFEDLSQEKLGPIAEIKNTFLKFQKYLYKAN